MGVLLGCLDFSLILVHGSFRFVDWQYNWLCATFELSLETTLLLKMAVFLRSSRFLVFGSKTQHRYLGSR